MEGTGFISRVNAFDDDGGDGDGRLLAAPVHGDGGDGDGRLQAAAPVG